MQRSSSRSSRTNIPSAPPPTSGSRRLKCASSLFSCDLICATVRFASLLKPLYLVPLPSELLPAPVPTTSPCQPPPRPPPRAALPLHSQHKSQSPRHSAPTRPAPIIFHLSNNLLRSDQIRSGKDLGVKNCDAAHVPPSARPVSELRVRYVVEHITPTLTPRPLPRPPDATQPLRIRTTVLYNVVQVQYSTYSYSCCVCVPMLCYAMRCDGESNTASSFSVVLDHFSQIYRSHERLQ